MSGSVHRLEGISNQTGGLIVKKKKSNPDADHSFKVPAPRSSLLGLDVLAAEKRKLKDVSEKEVEEEKSKRSKVTSYKDEWENKNDDSDDSSDSSDSDDGEDSRKKDSSHKR